MNLQKHGPAMRVKKSSLHLPRLHCNGVQVALSAVHLQHIRRPRPQGCAFHIVRLLNGRRRECRCSGSVVRFVRFGGSIVLSGTRIGSMDGLKPFVDEQDTYDGS